MKKIIFTILLLSSIVSMNAKANPIFVPPVISELYFVNNDWQLELNIDNEYFSEYGITNSDSLCLITKSDTAYFKPGWDIYPNTTFVITKDSLTVPVPIDKNGDYVRIGFKYYSWITILNHGSNEFYFGNYPGSIITAPLPGQSIKRTMQCYYSLVKDTNPTIGYDAFNATATVTVEGYVFDSNHDPFPGVTINFSNCDYGIVSNPHGYFEHEIYANYEYIYPYIQFCTFPDTSLFFEPDSTYNFDFVLNCYRGTDEYSKTPDYSLQVLPNPGSGSFTFLINAVKVGSGKKLIKIFNMAGELVNMIPVGDVNSAIVSVPWNGKGKYSELSAGMYTCSLEVNGQAVASVKLMIGQ